MAGNKRASMREGPLAALFRKTEQENRAARAPAEPREAAQAPEAAAEELEKPLPQDPEPRKGDAPDREPAEAEASTAVPTPQERLRAAFSPSSRRTCSSASRGSVAAPADVYARADYSDPPRGASVGQPRLRVVGVGGGGVNAVNRMVEAGVAGVEFIAVNTDLQSLQQCTADVTVHIGVQVTRGLGSGANAELGRLAAMEEYDKVKSLLKGSDMIFITAGEGGGTGTGAAR